MGRVRGRQWIKEHVTDRFVRRARAEGMRSRAAFKLEEIARRDRLFAPGMVVVDLGAAPGGWSQVAARAAGEGGLVFAVDILDMPAIAGVTFIRGDFRDPAVAQELDRALGRRMVDLVLSDMAPNLSGIASADQARATALAELARDFALKRLKPRGNLLVKAFHGAGYAAFVAGLRGAFERVDTRKPEASRNRSSEVYLLARGVKRSRIERDGAAGAVPGAAVAARS
ncbi:MAG: RlmE family RNA methyltransferase [Burkholderiales bacterium]|nr:RlmE family RNA methyltransferase [Burkholderiales bacterium]